MLGYSRIALCGIKPRLHTNRSISFTKALPETVFAGEDGIKTRPHTNMPVSLASTLPETVSTDEDDIKPTVHASTPISFATTLPATVSKGDVVELRQRNSTPILGLVTFCTRDQFDVLDTQDKTHIASLADVALAIRLKKGTGTSTWFSTNSTDALRASQESSLELIPDLDPYTKLVYAKFSQPECLGAFEFSEALALVQRARNKSGATLEQALAVYYNLCNSEFFTRFKVFAAKAHCTMEGTPRRGVKSRCAEDPFISQITARPPLKAFGRLPEFEDIGVCSHQALDVGCMLREKFDRFLVSICLPIIPWKETVDGTRDVGLRGLSVPNLPMVDFRMARHRGLKQKPEKCLVVSALVNPWDNKVVETSVSLGSVTGQSTGYFTPTFKMQRDLETLKSVFNALCPHVRRSEFESPFDLDEDLFTQQARHLASVWASDYAKEQGIDMCWLVQQHADSTSYRDFNENEHLSATPGPHEYLQAKAYAPVGYPFDSALSAVNQNQLVKHLLGAPITEGVCDKFSRSILPNVVLARELSDRSNRLQVLQQLEQSQGWQFLHCQISRPGKQGCLVAANCFELGFDVLVRASMDVKPGDTVVCNDVESINAYKGECVLKM